MEIRKSQAFVIIIFLMGLLILGLAISILMKPLGEVYNDTYNKTSVQDDDYQQFFTRSKTVWQWSPLLLVLGMIIWVLIKTHEKNEGLG